MRIVDFTLAIPEEQDGRPTRRDYGVAVRCGGETYAAVCHTFAMDGMSGTYIDFPGHIRETDDGRDAGSIPVEEFFMLETTVVRLDRRGRGREITRRELEEARTPVAGAALVVHALGDRDFPDVPGEEMPYFGPDTFEWIAATGIRLFASDVYEKQGDIQGIFGALFRAGVSTVCHPVNLAAAPAPRARCCAVFNRHPGAVQLPCRFFAVES